jgi:hypothetical protein
LPKTNASLGGRFLAGEARISRYRLNRYCPSCSSYDDNPRHAGVQHYVRLKVPEIMLAGGRRIV